MRVRKIWQQNVEEKRKKRGIMSIPLLVRKAEERLCGGILRFTQKLSKCFQRPLPAICKVLFWSLSQAVLHNDQCCSVFPADGSSQ